MNREQFKRNLEASIENKDQYVNPEDIERFLALNFDEDSSIAEWDYDDFSDFSSDLCNNFGDFWKTVSSYDLHCPDKHYRIRTTSIDYHITRQDIEDTVLDSLDDDERESMSEDELDEMIEQALEDTRDELPQELEFELDCQEDELEDIICDWISDETGWFINYFNYQILEESC
jgi:hypothetical protein